MGDNPDLLAASEFTRTTVDGLFADREDAGDFARSQQLFARFKRIKNIPVLCIR